MSFKIGRKTLLDLDSVEYQWIRTLASEGSSEENINHSICRCLGADHFIADKMRKVALGQAPLTDLLQAIPTYTK